MLRRAPFRIGTIVWVSMIDLNIRKGAAMDISQKRVKRHYGMRMVAIFAFCLTIFFVDTLRAQDFALKSVQSCVTIKGLSSTGSGFFFKAKNGKVYIATNKHVVENEISIEIRDIDDNVFKPVKIWADPHRDLAFIEFDGGEVKPRHILSADLSVSELSFGRDVVAYGDSNGEGTIVALEGKLLGIGPSTIETDAYIIHGNSGGPIVDQRTGAVLGISTRLGDELNQDLVKGSRFEGKIRRFGTRVDNVKFNNLKEADYIKYAYNDYSGLAEYAMQLIKAGKNIDQVQSILWHLYINGDIQSMGMVASELIDGYEGEIEDNLMELVVEAILSAAESGSSEALTWKGLFYSVGFGSLAKNSKKAFDCFLQAAEKGVGNAQYWLYLSYLNGTGVPMDGAKAREWLKKAAENKLPEAMSDYAMLLCMEDNPDAVSYINSAVDAECDTSYDQRGQLAIEEGKNEEAAYWFQRGAEAGDSSAMHSLALCYRDGVGVDQNIFEAINWYTNSAACGNLKAIRDLGYLYLDSDNEYGTRDYEESLMWFARGAELYDGQSLCRIGIAYLNGLGIEKDEASALFYMEKSAARGNSVGISNVAYMYANGIGAEKDIFKALEWCERGYNQEDDGSFAWSYCNIVWNNLYSEDVDDVKVKEIWLTWFIRAKDCSDAREWLESVSVKDKRFEWIVELSEGKVNIADNLTLDVGDFFAYNIERFVSPTAAFLWYSKAFEVHENRIVANLKLAVCYYAGFGTEVNSERARQLLNELKNEEALPYFVEVYTNMAERRSASSEYFLALFYKYGIGVEVDVELSDKLMERAKEDGAPFFNERDDEPEIAF